MWYNIFTKLLITYTMKKQSSLKIFLLTKSVKRKGPLIFVLLLFLVCLSLPQISSFAKYYEKVNENYLTRIHNFVQKRPKYNTEKLQLYVTAYTSSAAETDSSPCIAASGFNLCENNQENVVACNFLPIGTKLKIPEYDPETVFTVVDRMNERYNSRLDIWMKSHSKAKQFGVKYLTIEIYK